MKMGFSFILALVSFLKSLRQLRISQDNIITHFAEFAPIRISKTIIRINRDINYPNLRIITQ